MEEPLGSVVLERGLRNHLLHGDLHTELFRKFTDDGIFLALALLDFSAGKFPPAAHLSRRIPVGDENLLVVESDARYRCFHFQLLNFQRKKLETSILNLSDNEVIEQVYFNRLLAVHSKI